jgi:hypothetical protein
VTSWFLLALIALAAVVGSGLELNGAAAERTTAPTAADVGRHETATDRRADARVPFVGAVVGSPAATSAPSDEPASGAGPALVSAPQQDAERAQLSSQWSSRPAVGGSGRAPPVTTGT